MALDIDDLFNADPEIEIKRKANPNAGISALMKGGYYDADKGSVQNLLGYMFLLNDPENAKALAGLYGGTPVTDETSEKDFNISLFPESTNFDGVVTADSFTADMRLYVNNQLTHHCTGTKFLSHPLDESLIGTPCGCPTSLENRKKAANAKVGPSPHIEIVFSLPNDDDFKVKMNTSSWSILRILPSIVNQVIAAGRGGEALVNFSKKQVTTSTRSFIVPEITVKGAYNDAIAA